LRPAQRHAHGAHPAPLGRSPDRRRDRRHGRARAEADPDPRRDGRRGPRDHGEGARAQVRAGEAASGDSEVRIEELRAELAARGAKPAHVRRLVKTWLRGDALSADGGPRDAPYPRRLAESLPPIASRLSAIATPVSEHPGEDGSLRTLLRLADGLTVES